MATEILLQKTVGKSTIYQKDTQENWEKGDNARFKMIEGWSIVTLGKLQEIVTEKVEKVESIEDDSPALDRVIEAEEVKPVKKRKKKTNEE